MSASINEDKTHSNANPFMGTQKIAEKMMLDAVRSGDATALEITKVAIAIFTECLQKSLAKRPVDIQALREDLYALIGAEVKKVATKRVLADIESALGPESKLCGTEVGEKPSETEKLDNSAAILHSLMVTSCLEQTNKLITSSTFVDEASALLLISA